MKSLIVGACLTGLVLGLFVALSIVMPALSNQSKTIKEPIKRCRVSKVFAKRDYEGLVPDITYKLVTDEGYVLFSRNRDFKVGDSIEVQVIRISK